MYWIPTGAFARSLASLSLLEGPRLPVLAVKLEQVQGEHWLAAKPPALGLRSVVPAWQRARISSRPNSAMPAMVEITSPRAGGVAPSFPQ
jgi:hypothetical protein